MNLSEPYVFIPGWGFQASIWKNIANHFENSYLIDLPLTKKNTLTALSKRIYENIPDQSIIIAWSLGGLVSIQLAKLFPEKCKKLILVSTSPCFAEKEEWNGLSQNLIENFLNLAKTDKKKLFQHFIQLVQFPDRDLPKRKFILDNMINVETDNENLIDALSLLFFSDLRKEYASLKQPVYHFVSEKDAITKVNKDDLEKLNESVKILKLSHASHVPFVTQSEEFLNLLGKCDAN